MPDSSDHPSELALALFGQGKLPEPQARIVAAHLDTCLPCSQAAAALPPDTFQGKVRAAKPGGSSVPPNWPPAAAPGQPPQGGAAPAEVPPELADHPKFRIVRELGKGGMGVIYLAEHRVLEKPVALKVISPALLDDPEALARFRAEARAAASLDHPNIARAIDADQAGDLHFLVMEYVEGLNLAQILEKRGSLPVANACSYAAQAAKGLQHAFERGMVHRDVKPHNLMLTREGKVKVLDFGLARMRSERQATAPRLTQLEAFMGTAEYVAPEQAEDARRADIRADVYSLGCTLYHMLAGRPPFVEDTAVKLVLAHMEKEAPPLHEVRPDVPAELSAVVAKMLAKGPEQRYQQPGEVAQALRPFIKPGSLPRVAGELPAPSGATRAGTGTRTGGASEIEGLREAVGGREPPAETPDEGSAADPFERLEDEAAPPEEPGPAAGVKYGRRAMLIGIAAVVLALGLGALVFGVVVYFAPPTPPEETHKDSVLVIEVNEPNPDLYANGKPVTVAWGNDGKRAELLLKPGPHRVEVRKIGFIGEEMTLTIKEGDRQVFPATLRPNQQNPPPKKEGLLRLRVNEPNSEVLLNGAPAAVTWDERGVTGDIPVAPGRYRVQVKKKGFKDYDKPVQVEAGATRVVGVELEPL